MNTDSKIVQLIDTFKLINKKTPAVNSENIINLIKGFQPFLHQINEARKISTPDYNIFKVLKIQFKETKVHTPFLTNILDPTGSHAQQSLFLNSFIQTVLSSDVFKLFSADFSNVKVNAEVRTPYGIIDILILNNTSRITEKFAIIIENKIFAPEQENQVSRYYDYARNFLRLNDDQIIIAYLTLNRRGPSAKSLDTNLQIELLNKGVLKLICYNPDIVMWLQGLVETLESQQLKQPLIHYINIIKEFSYAEYE
jgi:hypothetical protein